jgi:hypothetical protein
MFNNKVDAVIALAIVLGGFIYAFGIWMERRK